ncbi:hypothetical protein GBA52_015156 [Prunus armeniaca]|nr:hypothetical protein GBA52_015156 [Prunus armeniaca]
MSSAQISQGQVLRSAKVKSSDQPRSSLLISQVEVRNPTPSPVKQFQVTNISECFNQDQNPISYNVSPDVKLKSWRSKPKAHIRAQDFRRIACK